jgi:hypothetical protein
MTILERIAYTIMAIIVMLTLALVMIEWVVGCGESYVDSAGTRHYNECVFVK